ncbi:MAG: glucosaminidase domain-containing protein [Rhodovibrionaceae bacterium]
MKFEAGESRPKRWIRSGATALAICAGLSLTLGFALPEPVGDYMARKGPDSTQLRVQPGLLSVAEIVQPRDVADLDTAFQNANYSLPDVREGLITVPRLYVTALPADFLDVAQVEERKELFIRTVLPLVLIANEELRSQRRQMIALLDEYGRAGEVGILDQAWLDALTEHYKLKHGQYDLLRRRIDEVPPSLAVAQAIVESGWGTSRFALEGNALFGQRTLDGVEGAMIPELAADVRVKAFDDLMSSVRAYMYNLNTHPAYAEFRQLRAKQRSETGRAKGSALAGTLTDYAELEDYIARLRALIRINGLAALDRVYLSTGELAERILPPVLTPIDYSPNEG